MGFGKCPVEGLETSLEQLSAVLPKAGGLGNFERIGISKDQALSIFEELKKGNITCKENEFSRWNLSLTGSQIANFLLHRVIAMHRVKIPQWPIQCFIGQACFTIDIILRKVFEVHTEEELYELLPHLKQILRSRALFFPDIEKILHRNPEIVAITLDKDKCTESRKLCPAFPIMDQVLSAVIPHYVAKWKLDHSNA